MILETKNISKSFTDGKDKKLVLDKVNISIESGKTIGILGESGSGKSTLSHILVGQIGSDSGDVIYHGEKIQKPYKGLTRKNIQMIYQHPEVSFNPKKTIYYSLKEIYAIYKIDFNEKTLYEHMAQLGIYEEHIKRYPSQLSGGQLQRASIGRALLLKHEILTLDEATSMLDIISQAQILKILKNIQKKEKNTYIFISHDEKLCDIFSDYTYKIEKGEIR